MDVYVVAYPKGVVVLITVIAMQPSNNGDLGSFMSSIDKCHHKNKESNVVFLIAQSNDYWDFC